MRVQLIKEPNLRKKALELTGDMRSFDDFIQKVREADWDNVNDIKNTFATADPIGSDRVIFDLPNNNRMVCAYNFVTDIKNKWVALYIAWVGNHEEYDILNENTYRNREPNLKTVWKF